MRDITPERMYDHLEKTRPADWLLFPEYWRGNALAYGLGALDDDDRDPNGEPPLQLTA